MKKILIVEDDPAILMGLKATLEEENYEIYSAEDGQIGYDMVMSQEYDLITLDIMLPNKNGLDILRDIRKNGKNTPVLMLTSKKEEIDKVLGFEIGADDYVTKPFSLIELKMRIKAILRRSGAPPKELQSDSYTFRNITLEYKKCDAFRDGQPLGLSAKEFNILKYFAEKEGEVISRNQMLDDIWGYDNFPSTRTVDNYILSIRKKIEKDPANPGHLITIHTIGYKFLK